MAQVSGRGGGRPEAPAAARRAAMSLLSLGLSGEERAASQLQGLGQGAALAQLVADRG
jgi:hypothetical protein